MRPHPFALFCLFVACGSPKIETHCLMNGLGVGSCTFTNTGSAPGAVCGAIHLYQKGGGGKATDSSPFCSGEVAKSSTVTSPFQVLELNTICALRAGTDDKAWTDACDFVFVERPSTK